MKVVVFSFDFPYPPNRGGRADVWRRIVALKNVGCEIFLVAWCVEDISSLKSSGALDAVSNVVSKLIVYPVKRGFFEFLKRFLLLPFYPSHVASRRVSRVQFVELAKSVSSFSPDAIWSEGPYPGLAAMLVSERLSVPLYYRSHNIEHLYMARQAAAARELRKKFAWYLACIGLYKFQLKLMNSARIVFDISSDDMKYWRERGVSNIKPLLPLPESAVRDKPYTNFSSKVDVLFLGNLTTPNNIRGIEFLVTQVAPRVLSRNSNIRFVVAGSNPGDVVRDLVARSDAFSLMENVPDALAVMNSARVLVNPVRTGSGVMVKMLDMLMTNAFIVTSSQGLCGLPEAVRTTVVVADDAADFSDAIIAALEQQEIDAKVRVAVRGLFTLDAIRDVVRLMEKEVPACR